MSTPWKRARAYPTPSNSKATVTSSKRASLSQGGKQLDTRQEAPTRGAHRRAEAASFKHILLIVQAGVLWLAHNDSCLETCLSSRCADLRQRVPAPCTGHVHAWGHGPSTCMHALLAASTPCSMRRRRACIAWPIKQSACVCVYTVQENTISALSACCVPERHQFLVCRHC